MILRLINDGNVIEHSEKTVKDFINNIIYKTEDKENKAFLIHTTKALNGNQNMILYFQDGVLKSHHTSFGKFDYNDVLNYEVSPSYRVKYIVLEDILSLDADYKKQMEDRYSRKIIDRYSFSYRYGTDYVLNRMFDDDELKRFIKEQDDDRFKEVVSILCDKVLDNESNILSLKNIIKERARDIYILEQQIKWLSKKSEIKKSNGIDDLSEEDLDDLFDIDAFRF
ncbi:hypothetical protein JJB46_08500 [Clostridium perfringens]|uniref:hypothetical protein n=1 Tax=Clostridium perfringens TaxID=1502 RepID=UPI001ABABF1E|nr:hypothetical protein [Clostridium perfringens]MBO3388303.1 hypothetical protein [Clostridium perfringens]MBO3413760.1 hypothetical protein [Clostridium perfringens]